MYAENRKKHCADNNDKNAHILWKPNNRADKSIDES